MIPSFIYGKQPVRYKYYRTGEVKFEYKRQKNQLIRVTHYYKNGSVKSISHFKNGHKHGLWQDFNEEGQQITNAFFHKNKKDGFWTFYNPNGEFYCSMYFKGNKIVKVIEGPIASK